MSGSVVSIENIVDRVLAMREQEGSSYAYKNYLPSGEANSESRLNITWREKIVHWSYNVVDHFDLSREVVAISLDLFDRFLATRGNKCNGNLALLTSLTTLHLAIKIHDTKKIRLSTLANLSRGQFGPSHIEEMEWTILTALKWKVHPPTSYSFIYHLLLFLPPEANPTVRKDIFELSRYLTELTACDSYFVEAKSSAVAFAAILNVIEDLPYTKLSAGIREKFLRNLSEKTRLHHRALEVMNARHRIATMVASQNGASSAVERQDESGFMSEDSISVLSGGSANSRKSIGSAFLGARGRANSYDSKGSCRSARRRIAMATSPMSRGGSRRVSSSPIVAGVQ